MKLKLALLFFLFTPTIALAQTGVSISANVLSGVSASVSTFVSDIIQLPADGTSVVILTATIFTKEGLALPNKEITVSSNRGEIDKIFCYSGNTLTSSSTATTDAEGKARCAASSEVPGNATFTAVADTITLDNKPTVTFTPLPVLTNLTVKVQLPGGGTLTILEPPAPTTGKTPSPASPSTSKLVNTGIEFNVPFWILILIIFFFITEPILIVLVLRLTRRTRLGIEAEKRSVAKEQELLTKIYQLESQVVQTASDIEQEVRQIESPNQSQVPSPPSTTLGINQFPPTLPQGTDAGQSPPTQ